MAHRLWGISKRVTISAIKFEIDSPLIAYYYAIPNANGEFPVSRDNNNAVINPREVSWNGTLIMHAKCCWNPYVEPMTKLNCTIRDRFTKLRDRFRINRINLL